MAKSGAEDVPPMTEETGETETSAAGGGFAADMDADLMASGAQVLSTGSALGGPDLDPVPSVLGPSTSSSSYEDEDGDAGVVVVSDDDEAASKGGLSP